MRADNVILAFLLGGALVVVGSFFGIVNPMNKKDN